MNPRTNQTLQDARYFKMANDVDSLKRDTELKLDTKFAEIEGVLTETKETNKESKALIQETKQTIQTLETNFEEHTNEVVNLLTEIKTNGLKGDPGEPADEEAIEQRLLDKIPTLEKIVKELPTEEEIAQKVIKLIPENKPSLKIIQENIDIEAVTEKVIEELDLDKVKKDLQKEIKLEVSRNKGYQGGSGGGLNNIQKDGTTVSTGQTYLNFTGAGVSSVTKSGQTTTVTISGGGGGGGITRSISSISSNTTAGSTASTDYVYLVSGTTTLTLPTAVGNTNRYTIKRVGAGVVTIGTTSAQTIDGSSTASLNVQYQSVDLISDNSNWNVI